MSNITLSITAESTQELQGLLKELAEGGITVGTQTVATAKSVEKTTEQKNAPVEKEAVSNSSEPEIATRNRWLELTDGTMVAIKKGEELPPAEERSKNVKKEEFEAWEQAQLSGDADDEDPFADEGDEGDDFGDDGFDDEPKEESNVIDFETFKQIVKLFGSGGNAERGKTLMKKHSQTGAAAIGQYEDDEEGRAAIDAELREKWSNYEKAIAKVTGA